RFPLNGARKRRRCEEGRGAGPPSVRRRRDHRVEWPRLLLNADDLRRHRRDRRGLRPRIAEAGGALNRFHPRSIPQPLNAAAFFFFFSETDMLPLKDPGLLRDKCLVNGEWVEARSGKTVDVTNPATGELIARVPSLSAEE